MKHFSIAFIILFTTISCVTTNPSPSFDNKVNTQVALAFTATALDEIVNKPTDTPIPTVEETLLPTSTEVMLEGDPKNSLGTPTWRDDLSTGINWNLETSNITFGNTKFSAENGKLIATSSSTSEGYVWWLNFRRIKNAYIEATFEIDSCSGNDQYGLVVRSVNYDDGYAYYYVITCDGKYDIRRRTSAGSVMLFGQPESDQINTGSNQTNTLGVWMKNDILRLYINGQFLNEISDKELLDEGYFGLFINAVRTPGFTIKMDEIAYWLLD